MAGPVGKDHQAGASAIRLPENEATNRALLEAIPDALYRVDRTGLILSCTLPPGHMLPPRLPRDVRGLRITETLPPDVAGERLAIIAEVLETGESRQHEYALHWNGLVAYRETRVVRLGPDEVLCLVRNVDEQKRAEHEREQLLATIESERRRLDTILRQMPALVIVYDAAGHIIQVNDRYRDMLGLG